eukprot:g15514.t1
MLEARRLQEDQFEVCLNKRSSGSFGFTLEYDFKENLHLDPKDPLAGNARGQRARCFFAGAHCAAWLVGIVERTGTWRCLQLQDPCLLLSLDGGAIEQWNAKNPEQRLQVGDRIVSANGTAGPSQQIFETIKEADEVTLVMQRAKVPRALRSIYMR